MHFICISKDGKTSPFFEYYMYVAIKSAHSYNPGWKVHLYITRDCEPVGTWYTRLLNEVSIEVHEIEDQIYF